MKRFRLPAIAVGAVVVVLLLGLGVVFNASFQTWAARRALASQAKIRGTIGSVAAGLKHMEARDVRLERDGAVLIVPRLEADLPLYSAGFRDRVLVSRLAAKGWTLDLSKTSPAATPLPLNDAAATGTAVPASGSGATAQAVTSAFNGVFAHLGIPVDLSLDNVDLEGEVILPALRGRMKVTLRGGGVQAGREGKFDFTADATLRDPAVSALELRGDLVVAMDTPRSLTRLTAKVNGVARGNQFPSGVKLSADLSATRAAAGETYSAAVVMDNRHILDVHADFPSGGQQLAGTWKLDVRDADVAPFALGRPLPAFTAVGGGKFETDATFTVLHAAGNLNATADQLNVLVPQLTEIGALKFKADFDLSRHGDAIAVQKIESTIGNAKPIARVESLQAFEFNPRTRVLTVADPARELVAIALQGVPLAWTRPFSGAFALTGGDISGDLVVTTRGRGMTVRAKTPLSAEGVSFAQDGKPLLEAIDVTLETFADYAPEGWQADVSTLTLKVGGVALAKLVGKAGQLAGKEQPVKSAGKLTLNLPALIAQPVARDTLKLSRGEGVIDFAASLDGTKELQAKIVLSDLAAVGNDTGEKLPSVTIVARADVTAAGRIAVNAPILLERGEHKSDLTLAGTLTPDKSRRTIDAQLTSNELLIDDARALAVLLPDSSKANEEIAPTTRKAPVWAGLDGTVNVRLKKVVYENSFQATDVGGTLRLEGGALKLELVRAGLGEGGEAKLNGAVTFDAAARQPYAIAAELVVTEFDVGSLLRAMNPAQAPTIEGKFNIASKLAGRSATLGTLARGTGGDFRLTSRGGFFRGLPLNVSNLADNTGMIAGWIASARDKLGALTGKKDDAEVLSKVQAAGEVAKGINPIPYDQLSVVLTRDGALNTELKDFTLIAPEVRLTGTGRAAHRAGGGLLNDALTMDFNLRARGRLGLLLKSLGALDAQADDLGYSACSIPIKVSGTLGQPDGSDLNQRVIGLVLEKSSFVDKAMDWFGKPRAGKSGE